MTTTDERTELEVLKMIAVLAAELVVRLESNEPARGPGVTAVRWRLAGMLDRLNAIVRTQQRLIRTCPPVDAVPLDNDLDAEAYDRARSAAWEDEVHDDR